jgi:hypothetical protein
MTCPDVGLIQIRWNSPATAPSVSCRLPRNVRGAGVTFKPRTAKSSTFSDTRDERDGPSGCAFSRTWLRSFAEDCDVQTFETGYYAR